MVGALGDFEFQFEFKVGELFNCDYIAADLAEDGKSAVLDFPAFFGKGGGLDRFPACAGLAIPEEFPTVCFFLICQRVGFGSRLSRGECCE